MPRITEAKANLASSMCRFSGSEAAQKVALLQTLRECREELQATIKEAAEARVAHDRWRTAEIVTRVVLVSCDALIGLIAMKTGPAGMLVGKAYDLSKLVVDVTTGGALGERQAAMMVLKNKAQVAEYTAKTLGKKKLESAIAGTSLVIELADTIQKQISEGVAGSNGAAGIDGALRSSLSLLQRFNGQIARLEVELANC